ncbi:MAG: S41 family peptidase [Sediminibacterium sp.]|nr:S41 family peptidase [Sediminibacterium sp.]
MRLYSIFLIIAISFFLTNCNQNIPYSDDNNLGFELINSSKLSKWKLYSNAANKEYSIFFDSINKKSGKYSLCISKIDPLYNNFEFFNNRIPAVLNGKFIKLSAFIKTQNVSEGYGGIWIRIEGTNRSIISFDNMQDNGVVGTSDWHKISVSVPYDSENSENIYFGGMLTGNGKVWFDDFNLQIDGKDYTTIKTNLRTIKTNSFDSIYSHSQTLSQTQISQLANICKVWGFLKYYHSSINSINYNWDFELLNALSEFTYCRSNVEVSNMLERMTDKLGKVNINENTNAINDSTKTILQPNYSNLFTEGNLSNSLFIKLKEIKDNYQTNLDRKYIELGSAGNAVFKNELIYLRVFPDPSVRLLALFRYWNMINYFYPYRNLSIQDWNRQLNELIPIFLNATDKNSYLLSCLNLISKINDSHASIWNNKNLDSLKGLFVLPFQTSFVEGKLIVSSFPNSSNSNTSIRIGDIIENINKIKTDSLVKSFVPYTPGSNYETILRELASPRGFLTRSNLNESILKLRRNGVSKMVTVRNLPISTVDQTLDFKNTNENRGYFLFENGIGYINTARLNEMDLISMQTSFKKAKGIIFDLRCYPSTFMPYTYGRFLKKKATPFALLTGPDMMLPGLIKIKSIPNNGGLSVNQFEGVVVLLVNSITQSQAEFTTMALQSRENTIVIGSQTAGADGDVSSLILPGDINTAISGLGVYYPDFTPTQGRGVKIDYVIKPTIKGIQKGKDELLEFAVKKILNENFKANRILK